jgi:hypothetical protein
MAAVSASGSPGDCRAFVEAVAFSWKGGEPCPRPGGVGPSAEDPAAGSAEQGG